MNNAYVLQRVDSADSRASVIGVFEALGLAEMAKEKLEAEADDYERDAYFYRITAFEMGKVY